MQKTVFFWSFWWLLVGACSVINENPIDAISTDTYFQNYKDAEAAVIGAYSTLTTPNLYGRLRVVTAELSSQNIVYRTATFEYAHFSNFNIVAENILLQPMWSEMYRGIMRANYVMEGIGRLDAKNRELAAPFLGEAYFLRAFFYFDLVRMFGGVPLVTQPSPNLDLPAVRIARTEPAKIYAQIIADLQEAEKLLPDRYAASIQTRGRATKMTAKAYLAKVYLYQQNYAQSLSKLEEVLKNTATYQLVSLPVLYNNGLDNLETVFGIYFQNEVLALQYLPISAPYNGTGTYWVNQALLALFEPNDKRQEYLIFSNNNWFVGKQKRLKVVPADPVYCLRVAELHLIRAELLARLAQRATPEALTALNLVRQRAGIEPQKAEDFANLGSFLEAVLIEKRKEMMFETGDFWFDAIRAGYTDKLLGVKDQNAYLYPIPSIEIERNPNLTQNPGY